MRRKAAQATGSVDESPSTVGAEEASLNRISQSWAMLIKRVYEVDPLSCVRMCGPDGGGGLHRTAASRRDRADLATLWPLTLVGTQSATGHCSSHAVWTVPVVRQASRMN